MSNNYLLFLFRRFRDRQNANSQPGEKQNDLAGDKEEVNVLEKTRKIIVHKNVCFHKVRRLYITKKTGTFIPKF